MNSYYTITPTQMSTSWQPEAAMNTKIQADSNITSNWKYRQYMQNNASHIMKYNSLESIYSSGNNPYTVVNNQPSQVLHICIKIYTTQPGQIITAI